MVGVALTCQVVEGKAATAAIDSQLMMKLRLRDDPILQKVKVLEMLPAQPIQPVAISSSLPLAFRNAIRTILIDISSHAQRAAELRAFGYQVGFHLLLGLCRRAAEPLRQSASPPRGQQATRGFDCMNELPHILFIWAWSTIGMTPRR